ncbi:hypothetical protein K402DRAFT_342829 [Aulographum hederae CBS 113979]|uniref:Rpr2-domain-containing protein n=1 Tax=Aulographum hederae CBS 113979 TaxID=1176131 RepID=A0A6G1GJX3_9PEZI|nr:hypothetical protein K402DRAFT_342829 [Aulographum hederae CBS 113979]
MSTVLSTQPKRWAAHDARLNYLDQAAHFLAPTAPSTAAFLQSGHSELTFEKSAKVAEERRRSVCGACGNIMLPGWTCRVDQEVCKPHKQHARPVQTGAKSIVYHCLGCKSKTRFPVNRESRRPMRPKARNTMEAPGAKQKGLQGTISASRTAPQPEVSSTASTKQKNRTRKQAGLSAQLAQTKSNSKSGLGLDLMDFMKSG